MNIHPLRYARWCLLALLLLPGLALAAAAKVPLDDAPVNVNDHESLQRGAAVFIHYCLSCHSANYMRYNRMTDIGLSEQQIKDHLLFATDKPGDLMHIAMRADEAKEWFGAAPPDLTVIARSRGEDWLYTFLRGFYRDDTRHTGWNNTVFENTAMPHALHELQGQMRPVMKTVTDPDGRQHQVVDHLTLAKPGKLTQAEYDALMADLVNYLVWMGEPSQSDRKRIGLVVLLFLSVFFVVAYYLKQAYWKDVH